MNTHRPYKAIWIRHNKIVLPLVPLHGVAIFLALLGTMVVLAFLAERELALLATKGLVVSPQWVSENQLINRENYARIQSSRSNPIFRSVGYTPPEPVNGRRRILVVGDSFIWGDGLTNINMTWWRQLQWELERRGYQNVDVLAAGVNGASTQDQYEWITSGKLLEQTKPDAIVFGYVTNDPHMKDIEGNDLVKRMPQSAKVDLESSAVGRFFPNLAFELSSKIIRKREPVPNDEIGYPYGLWELKILEGENFRHYKELLPKLAKTIEEASIPTFFVTTPNSPSAEYFETRYAPVRTAFKAAGIRFIDLLPQFLDCCSEIPGRLIWVANPANGHPGPRTTRFYAKHVADILEKDYPHVLGSLVKEQQVFVPKINDWLPTSLSTRQISPSEWEIDTPVVRPGQLYMPIEESHIALNFERPVSIRQIRLQGDVNVSYRLWATILDDQEDYELRDYAFLGKGKGVDIAISVPPELSSKRITSLRVAIDVQPVVKPLETLRSDKISEAADKAYHYPLPEFVDSADSLDTSFRSPLLLLENGKVLPYSHSPLKDIFRRGEGRYSHWRNGMLFSTSDNSDPRSNGRRYSIGLASVTGKTIRIGIEFNAQDVRL